MSLMYVICALYRLCREKSLPIEYLRNTCAPLLTKWGVCPASAAIRRDSNSWAMPQCLRCARVHMRMRTFWSFTSCTMQANFTWHLRKCRQMSICGKVFPYSLVGQHSTAAWESATLVMHVVWQNVAKWYNKIIEEQKTNKTNKHSSRYNNKVTKWNEVIAHCVQLWVNRSDVKRQSKEYGQQ